MEPGQPSSEIEHEGGLQSCSRQAPAEKRARRAAAAAADRDAPHWGIALRFRPSALEQQFWQHAWHARLGVLDKTSSVCFSLIWLAAYLEGSPPHLLLWAGTALAQLGLMRWAPGLWEQQRHALLCALQLLRTGAQAVAEAAGAGEAMAMGSLSALLQSRALHHGLLVLMLQMPLCHHLLWLVHSSACALATTLARLPGVAWGAAAGGGGSDPGGQGLPAAAGALLAPAALSSLAQRWLTGPLPPLQELRWQDHVGLAQQQQQRLLLPCVLFWHAFGLLLLPLCLAYGLEWTHKVQYLLHHARLGSRQTQLVTATAAVMHTSGGLGLALTALWLLLLAAVSWLACLLLAGLEWPAGLPGAELAGAHGS